MLEERMEFIKTRFTWYCKPEEELTFGQLTLRCLGLCFKNIGINLLFVLYFILSAGLYGICHLLNNIFKK